MAYFESKFKKATFGPTPAADPFSARKSPSFNSPTARTQHPGRNQAPAAEAPDIRGGPEEGWMNLQDYLSVNKTQADQMAKKVAGDVSKKGEAAEVALGSATAGFNQQAGLGAKQAPGSGQTSYAEAAALGAAQPIDTDLNNFAYDLSGSMNAANSAVGALGSETGQSALLDESYGKDTGYYGTMSKGLDQFMMGSEGKDDFQRVKDEYGGLSDDLLAAQTQANSDATAARENAPKWAAEAERLKSEADAKQAETDRIENERLANVAASEQANADNEFVASLGRGDDSEEMLDAHNSANESGKAIMQESFDAKYGPGAYEKYLRWAQRQADARKKRTADTQTSQASTKETKQAEADSTLQGMRTKR